MTVAKVLLEVDWISMVKKFARTGKLKIQDFLLSINFPRLSVPASRAKSVLLFPAAAPGGIGDDAMLNGSVASLFELGRSDEKIVVTSSNSRDADKLAPTLSEVRIWNDWTPINGLAASLIALGDIYIFGADILDGHYSYVDAARRIRLGRLFHECGGASRIVGFSLNERPHPRVIDEFNDLKGRVPLFLRDPLSLERAKKLISGDLRLSADVAFGLLPSAGPYSRSVADFAASARRDGRSVFGINVHDLFSKTHGAKGVDAICLSMARLIEQHEDCCFVLIPHDYRAFVDDRLPLQKILFQLTEKAKARTLFLNTPISAAEIKAVCGHLDGVVTGRMHLAIASLGSSVPILGIVYQGKFEGMLSYFEMESTATIDPVDVMDYSIFEKAFDRWRVNLGRARHLVEKNFPRVLSLSRSNFE